MKQKVAIVSSEEGLAALKSTLDQAQGTVFEHIANPEAAAKRLTAFAPELLVLVHPLPGYETVSLWGELSGRFGSAMPTTVVVAAQEDIFDLEPLREAGAHLVTLGQPEGGIESTLSSFLRQAPRPHARVMVKVAVELGAGRVLRIAQTVNVSRSGLLIRTREQFPAGSTLDLKIELPDDQDPIEARAEVVRMANPEIEDVRGLGARFIWFRGRDEERFDEFMRRAVSDSAAARRV